MSATYAAIRPDSREANVLAVPRIGTIGGFGQGLTSAVESFSPSRPDDLVRSLEGFEDRADLGVAETEVGPSGALG